MLLRIISSLLVTQYLYDTVRRRNESSRRPDTPVARLSPTPEHALTPQAPACLQYKMLYPASKSQREKPLRHQSRLPRRVRLSSSPPHTSPDIPPKPSP